MRPASYIFSGTVAAPIETVFALLTDPARMPDWLPGCRAARPSGAGLKKGTRFRLQMQSRLRTRELALEVIEYAEPTTFGWAELGPRSGTKTFFKLQFDGGATGVTMKHIWAPRGFSAWVRGAWRRRRQIQKQFDASLQNVRKLLAR